MTADAVIYGWEKPGEVELSRYTESSKGGIVDGRNGTIKIAFLPIVDILGEGAHKVLEGAPTKVLNVIFQTKTEHTFNDIKFGV